MDLLNGKVRVYNYEMSPIGFPSQINEKGVFIRGRNEDEEYVVERILWDDVEIENSKSDIFKIGRLRFNSEEENEVYDKLRIDDKENIMNDSEVIQLLKNDSVDTLKRINRIKSFMLLSRMKQLLFTMERGGQIPPHRVTTVLLEHIEEVLSGRKNDNSLISGILADENKEKEDLHLKETLAHLSNEIASLKSEKEISDKENTESKNALSDLLKMVQDLKAENESLKSKVIIEDTSLDSTEKATDEVKEEPVKKAGRPPKNS
jgi:hypothetical protein